MAVHQLVDPEIQLARIVRSARTVAVVGMKDERRGDEPAHAIPRLLRERGLRVIPVNPTIAMALGEPSLPSVTALPEAVDILNVFRRSDAIPTLVEEILKLPVERRPRVVWLQTGIRHEQAEERLVAQGIQVVTDRCLGVYAARYRSRSTD